MHYITLAAVNFSPTEEDEITNGKIIAAIEQLKDRGAGHLSVYSGKFSLTLLQTT